MLSLITPTGGRPEAFALCEQWIGRQTFQDFEWVVVDDVDPATPTTLGQTVVRPEPRWEPGKNTQFRNMLLGLEAARGNCVLIVEDDDWYALDYLEKMESLLSHHTLVGESTARYYHVGHRQWREYQNHSHASLCQTGFRREAFPAVAQICKDERWLDQAIWSDMKDVGFLVPGCRVVGMKGMPGRNGISTAHTVTGGRKWQGDAGLDQLRRWIGEDYQYYLQFANFRYHRNDPAAKEKAIMMENQEELQTFLSRGQVRYRCPECGFDSYSPAEVRKHWTSTHRQTEPPGPVLFDADDKPIQKEIYVPAGLRDIGSRPPRGPHNTAELRAVGEGADTGDGEKPGYPDRRLHPELSGGEGTGPGDPDRTVAADGQGRAGTKHGPTPSGRSRRRAGSEPDAAA